MATYIRELDGFTGQACLVELCGKFYAVSSTHALFGGFETLVFRCDGDGNVTDWGDVAGGRGYSREEAISDLEATISNEEASK